MSIENGLLTRPRIRTATPASVRAVNRSIALQLIRRRQPVSRAELARLTGIFRSSISEIVDELVAEGLVKEEIGQASGRGRIPIDLQLNDSSYPVLGINIRPQYYQIAYAGLSGSIQKAWNFDTPNSAPQLVLSIKRAIDRIRKELDLAGAGDIRSIGIAVPGIVDAEDGRIIWTPTHPELNGFPIAKDVSSRTGIITLAGNDCNLGALSELWLASGAPGDRTKDFVFLNVGDIGVGAGAVVNGQVYLGHDLHFAAEFGHMVVEPSGPLCSCSRRGCWELYVSNRATWKRFKPRTPFTPGGFDSLITAARAGNREAKKSLQTTATYLSLGISNIGFALNPYEIVVAGRIAKGWDLVGSTVERTYGSLRLSYRVRPATLTAEESLLHGAVCLALRDAFAAPEFGE
ncbi:MAG TPA: ROK family transcriptional regulator [Bryobacteraceae bacterium]|nr:ROK family transcriptional regulator [Bryobacteraceae bacterium]